MNAEEIARLAANLARNCGYRVLPCREDKRPATPHGFKDASNAPDAIDGLWRRYPGPLIGVATGAASGIDVLDLDQKHDEACAWWEANHRRLPPTRTFKSRSGGLHLWFQHAEGVRNSQARISAGVDVRGDGGFIIHWFSAGLPCLDHAPPAPWPAWLLHDVTYRPPPTPSPCPPRVDHASKAVEGVVQRVAGAVEGERNAVLFWAACRLAERGIGQHDVEALLLPAAHAAGLSRADEQIAARRTIASACRANGRAGA